MTSGVMILAIGIGLVMEQAFPTSAWLGFARPPVLACVIAYYAMNHSAPLMLFVALIGGLLSDCAAALPLGVTAAALAAVGIVLRHYRGIVFSGKLVTNVVFGGAIGVSAPLLTLMLLLFLGQTPAGLRLHLYIIKFASMLVYGAVFFPVIYLLLERLESLAGAGAAEGEAVR
jgi:rod shape-determining protein MreD